MVRMRLYFAGGLALVLLGLGACGGGGGDEGTGVRELALLVPDMTCENCVGPLRAALREVEGVRESRFDLEEYTIVVETEVDGPQVDVLVEAVREAGFTVEAGS